MTIGCRCITFFGGGGGFTLKEILNPHFLKKDFNFFFYKLGDLHVGKFRHLQMGAIPGN